MERHVFSRYWSFPKVSAENIYYYRQKPGETDIAHMVSNYKYHMPLN